tara:strand:- start:2180 stop:2851 length:672 start_codon:yes stop_codon:yes gene_type:complete
MRLEKGFIYIWALFAVALAGVLMAGIGQVWQIQTQREKEKELLFVGTQFRKAFMSYYNGATGGVKQYPESLEDLLLDNRSPIPKRHLRKIFIDPMTNSYEWGLIAEPIPEQDSGIAASPKTGIIGVHSRSKEIPIKSENFPGDYEAFAEAETYQDWQFAYVQGGGGSQSTQSQQSQPNPSSSESPFSSQSSSQSGESSTSSPFSAESSSSSSQSGQNPFAPQQ